MKRRHSTPAPGVRPAQELPGEIAASLMRVLRGQFYGDATPKQWFQDQKFLLKNVVTWPARWLNQKGVTLPPKRYEEIMLEIFSIIKVNGTTEVVQFWPGYLAHCVQQHFKHHGEDYYEEGKALRAGVERAMMAFNRTAPAATRPDPIAQLAQVHQVLSAATPKRRAKAQPAAPSQLSLF